jgi:hypothetical protein
VPRRSASIERIAGLAAAMALGIAIAGLTRFRDSQAVLPPIVTDAAGLLGEEQRARLELYHRFLLFDHDLDYRVEVVDGVADLDLYAHARFGELDIGSLSLTARGLLLVLDARQNLVRVEVGRSLEGALPDAFVAYLEQRQMVPYFREDQVGEGVLAATELLVTRIQDAKARADWPTQPSTAGSAGGGARTSAQLGSGPDPRSSRGPDVEARGSPEETVGAYLAAMRARNGEPELDLYTSGTRAMLGRRVITPAQMDAVARAYRGCSRQEVRLDASGRHAVVRYPVGARPAHRSC